MRKLHGCIIAMAVSPILKMMKLYASGYGWIFLSLIQSLISKNERGDKEKMRNLTYYAIQQVKASILRGEDVDPLREDEHISLLLNITVDSWRKDYKNAGY